MKIIQIAGFSSFMTLISVAIAQHAIIEPNDPFAPDPSEYADRVEQDQLVPVAIPKEYRSIEGANIQIEARNENFITFRLNNNSANPVHFACGGISNPSLDVEAFIKGKWQRPADFMKCGSFLYPTSLAPKKSILFKAVTRELGTPMRVGIRILGLPDAKGDRVNTMIWSPPIKEEIEANKSEMATPKKPSD